MINGLCGMGCWSVIGIGNGRYQEHNREMKRSRSEDVIREREAKYKKLNAKQTQTLLPCRCRKSKFKIIQLVEFCT